jgi:hypothetical protein
LVLVLSAQAQAQQVVSPGFESVGRGAPLEHDANEFPLTGATIPFAPAATGPTDFEFGGLIAAAMNGEAPEGVEPLERDIFTSDDFYADRDLWMDPRYYRCNSPAAIEDLWGASRGNIIGDNPPATAPWGFCDRDYPRESIVSPYPFETAQAHYEALLEETRGRGGPTEHTYATVPGEWTGVYAHPGNTPNNQYWYRMRHVQTPTALSLLTEEYQTRMVQETYHQGNTNAPQLARGLHAPVARIRRLGALHHGDSRCRANSRRRCAQLHHQHSHRSRVQHGWRRAAARRGRAALVRRNDRVLAR